MPFGSVFIVASLSIDPDKLDKSGTSVKLGTDASLFEL